MQIKEVLQATGLTRKAVEYYEAQGLLQPELLENGYREYGAKELGTLKEISVLRGCGLGIPEIREVLRSPDKPAVLAHCLLRGGEALQRMQQAQSQLAALRQCYDIEEAFLQMRLREQALPIRERMLLAFPGVYGRYLAAYFGRFLEEPIHTEAQRQAYEAIIAYWDHAAGEVSPELEAFLERALPEDAPEKLEGEVNAAMERAMEDPDGFLAEQEGLEEYIDYRTSSEFRESPAGRMLELLLQFQSGTGYGEIFLENLKLLSPAYKLHCERLAALDAQLLEKYPQAARMYADGTAKE